VLNWKCRHFSGATSGDEYFDTNQLFSFRIHHRIAPEFIKLGDYSFFRPFAFPNRAFQGKPPFRRLIAALIRLKEQTY
jgi:hypothetical protein